MVMDGQGGGIGATLIRGLREKMGNDLEILALGTNSIATSTMMKAGANRGATGENAIVQSAQKADIIVGTLSVLIANAMMGEVTPGMAEAVCSCDAEKIIVPLNQENIRIVGINSEPLPHLVKQVVEMIQEVYRNV
jgi:Domain of unknown function (DUF3842)